MKKVCKTLAFMLAFIMMFTALPVAELSAFAAEPAKMTEAWAPSVLDAADWNGATEKITDGVFALTGTESQFTIWTNQSFNVDDGFTFKGTLKMNNKYKVGADIDFFMINTRSLKHIVHWFCTSIQFTVTLVNSYIYLNF